VKPGEIRTLIGKAWKEIQSGKLPKEIVRAADDAGVGDPLNTILKDGVDNIGPVAGPKAVGHYLTAHAELVLQKIKTMKEDESFYKLSTPEKERLLTEYSMFRRAALLTRGFTERVGQLALNAHTGVVQGPPKYGANVPAWQRELTDKFSKTIGSAMQIEVFNANHIPDNHPIWNTYHGPSAIKKAQKGGYHGFFYPAHDPGAKKFRAYLVMKPSTTAPSAREMETMAHELGHAFEYERLMSVTPQQRMDLYADYMDWAMRTKHEYSHFDRKAFFSQQEVQSQGGGFEGSPNDYSNSFPEWFADQTARWFTTSKPAESFVDKFFKAVADFYKEIFAQLKRYNYVAPGVAEFYNGLIKARVAAAKKNKSGDMFDFVASDMPSAKLSDKDIQDARDETGISGIPENKPSIPMDDPTEQVDSESEQVATSRSTSSDQVSEDKTRTPRGSLTPGFRDVSFNSERSVWEGAFTDAGMSPDEGMLLKPEQKKNVLIRLLNNTFGINTAVASNMLAPNAVNSMLDAYRNVRFMLHTLGLPLKALGLGGTLNLSLEKFKGGYLGMFDGATMTIHMPDRSNSFAHEWMHALDAHLLKLINPAAREYLLSKLTRNEGLDPTNSLQEAFINLVNTVSFHETALALKIMDLEQIASQVIQKGPNAGQPTVKAQEAQKTIDRLKSGATRLKIAGTNFKSDSKAFGNATGGQAGAEYFGSIHEMLARAFEAWIAHKVELAGGTNEFITKGDSAYLSDEDPRLRMTFPKASERLAIFDAFEKLFDHIRAQAILGPGTGAAKPADENIMDGNFWNKVVSGAPAQSTNPFVEEWNAYKNAAKNMSTVSTAAIVAGTKDSAKGLGDLLSKVGQALSLYTNSYRSVIKALIKRNVGQGSEFLQVLANHIMTDIGVGVRAGEKAQGETFEDQTIAAERKADGRLTSVLRANGFMSKLLSTWGLKDSLSDTDNDTIRELLYGNKPVGATAQHKAVAAEIRRMFEDAFLKLAKAGVKLGYVKDTGYIPRVLQTMAVSMNPVKFVEQATKVYQTQFDRLTQDWASDLKVDDVLDLIRETAGLRAADKDRINALAKPIRDLVRQINQAQVNNPGAVSALEAQLETELQNALDAIRDPYSEYSAEDWKERILMGTSFSYDSHGPATQFTQPRTLPPEADQLMADFYETDVLASVMHYVAKAERKAAYIERFGTPGGNDSWESLLQRKDVKTSMAANPSKYNPNTTQGQLNILRDLTDKTRDNLIELHVRLAIKNGANHEDARAMRSAIEDVTGFNQGSGTLAERSRIVSGVISTLTFFALLGRAAQTSIMEPATILFRTGSVPAAMEAFTNYAGELANVLSGDKIQSVRQRAELARAIGLVASPLLDAIHANRLTDDLATGQDRLRSRLATFFRANGLTQLTNAQRRSAMGGAHVWLQEMAKVWQDPNTKATDKKVIEAEWGELGIPPEHFSDFADWMTQTNELPSVDDLGTTAGELWAVAVRRIVDQTIQEPRRMDKPAYAVSPVGKLVYALTSFSYAFFRNVHMATINRTGRDYEIRRAGGDTKQMAILKGVGDVAMTAGLGLGTMMLGQIMLSVLRNALFNPEQWDKKKKDGTLQSWLFWNSLSRSGAFGPSDLILNALTGVRYERDLTSLAAGPGLGLQFSFLQNLATALGAGAKNSPNTNTAERQLWKSMYMAIGAPLIGLGLSGIPAAGPLSWVTRYGALSYGTSQGAASNFADMMAGPQGQKGSKPKKSPYQ
jgi:hypothetical protein